MALCLGCGTPTEPGDVPSLPMLLHGKFCPVCAQRLGYVVPPEVDLTMPDDEDDYDDTEDDDSEGDDGQ